MGGGGVVTGHEKILIPVIEPNNLFFMSTSVLMTDVDIKTENSQLLGEKKMFWKSGEAHVRLARAAVIGDCSPQRPQSPMTAVADDRSPTP